MAKDSSSQARHAYRYQSLIQAQLTQLSTAEQAVAAHLAAHPEQVPFETAASIAKRLGVSAMTVGRTLKALGYNGLGDLRIEMRSEVPDVLAAPWVRKDAAASVPAPKNLDRARALRAELEAVEAVHALAETAPWQRAVEAIAAADQVFVIGFQTERGLAVTFADQLAYVRPHVRYLSVENRAFADLRSEATSKSCLVMIDCRRYSRWFRLLGQKAAELGIPLVIATDAYCRWATEITPHALQVRTDSGRFWDNNAPISSLLNLLIEDVIVRLGVAVYSQLDAASEFGAAFVGFDRVHRQRNHEAQDEPNLRGHVARDSSKARSKARTKN
jgi:DNA-binding MurR/RpiR family transcriptional regulator